MTVVLDASAVVAVVLTRIEVEVLAFDETHRRPDSARPTSPVHSDAPTERGRPAAYRFPLPVPGSLSLVEGWSSIYRERPGGVVIHGPRVPVVGGRGEGRAGSGEARRESIGEYEEFRKNPLALLVPHDIVAHTPATFQGSSTSRVWARCTSRGCVRVPPRPTEPAPRRCGGTRLHQGRAAGERDGPADPGSKCVGAQLHHVRVLTGLRDVLTGNPLTPDPLNGYKFWACDSITGP